MAKKENISFKCANDLKVNIAKDNGEVLINEECCTCISLILKNNGELATSFLGSHNEQMIKVLEKAIKVYFRSLKKNFKKQYKEDEDLKVFGEDIPEDKRWEESKSFDDKEKKSTNKKSNIKYESFDDSIISETDVDSNNLKTTKKKSSKNKP